jgi:hypothetical protein
MTSSRDDDLSESVRVMEGGPIVACTSVAVENTLDDPFCELIHTPASVEAGATRLDCVDC